MKRTNKLFLALLAAAAVVWGGCSNVEEFRSVTKVNDIVTPGGNGSLNFFSVTTNSMIVRWVAANATVTPQHDLQYCLYYSTNENISNVAAIETNGIVVGGYSAAMTNKVVSGLLHSRTYYFNVVVKNGSGKKAAYLMKAQTTSEGAAPTVTVDNLKNNATLSTGFIIGTAADNVGVASVEVSLDGGSYQTATGTSSWKFQLPTGANSWKRGSQHTISVRAKDNAGNYSTIVSLTVRKGVNKDVNGDGYADLVVGASKYNSNQGRVYIFYGSASGVSSRGATSANAILTGELTGQFGISVASGDINGDGYADIIVGAAYYSTAGQHGRAYVFNGGSTGIASKGAGSADTIISETSGMMSYLGFSVAAGDINGDGYEDVIVGAFASNGNQGSVSIFHGSSAGILSKPASSANTTITGEANSRFGWSVYAADFNSDGYLDVSVGAPQYNSNQGRSYLFYGGGSGISSQAAGSANCIITGEVNSMYGHSVVAGDMNGDGYTDLIVGARAYDSNRGRVYIFHSSSTGIVSMGAGSADSILSGEAGSSFGFSVSVGLVNGDGCADVVVGAYQYGGSQGRAYVFYGNSSGIGNANAGSASALLTGEPSSYFGDSVGLVDMNNDGYMDILVGGPSYNSFQGRVYLFHGSSTGASSMGAGRATTIFTGENASAFGRLVK